MPSHDVSRELRDSRGKWTKGRAEAEFRKLLRPAEERDFVKGDWHSSSMKYDGKLSHDLENDTYRIFPYNSHSELGDMPGVRKVKLSTDGLHSFSGAHYDDVVEIYRNALDHGIDIGPSTVIKKDGKYVVIDGNHRAEAHIQHGDKTIDARLLDFDNKELVKEWMEGLAGLGPGVKPRLMPI